MRQTRQLVTIGDLGPSPLRRQRLRRAAVTMGSATPTTAGSALQDASLTLLNYLDTNGVPPEAAVDPNVRAYQQAWNADPANAGDRIQVDGQYGPETQGTLNVMTGGIAPAVNGGPAPVPTPKPAPAVVPTPATPTAPGESHGGLLLLLAAAGLVAWLVFRKKKSVHHHHRGPTVELRSNPRRRRRNATALLP